MIRNTSILAYNDVKNKVTLMKDKILFVLGLNASGLTDSEICLYFPRSVVLSSQPRARRNELMHEGLVESLDKRKCRVTGRMALVWQECLKTNIGPGLDVLS